MTEVGLQAASTGGPPATGAVVAPGDDNESAAGSGMATADAPGAPVDGRRARRERNRESVVDAVLELLREGTLRPSTDQIAERAGLSPRSLFRYFDDVDDLFSVAIRKQSRFLGKRFRVEIDRSLPLADRVVVLVEHRLDLYDAISGVGVIARANEPFRPQVKAELTLFRAVMRDQLRAVVADDLAGFGADTAEHRLTAAEMLISFESYRMLRDDRGLDRPRAGRVLVDGLVALFASP